MKKLSILLVLTVLLAMVALPVSAASISTDVSVPATSDTGTVTLTIPVDAPTVAGQITISYDNRVLTYTEAAVETDLYSISAQSSSILIVYSNLEAADGILATVTFTYDSTVSRKTVVSVTTTSFEQGVDEAANANEQITLTLPTEAEICPSAAFTDVDTNKWYHACIDYVLENGLMNGLGNGLFAPNAGTTRAMFVTVLARLDGIDPADYEGAVSFTDVPEGQWFTPYVKWASENGIVLGYPNETFQPNGFITRQEMVAMLYRFAAYQGVDVSDADPTVLDAFTDAASVAGWAADAMAWAVSKEIVNGTTVGLEPAAIAARAEMAQVIMKYNNFAN